MPIPAQYPAKPRRTKIVATIGPASDSPDIIKAMINAGMNVARLNLSHGTLEEHKARLDLLRSVADEIGRHIAIMIDTRGIEIRTRMLAGGKVDLEPDDVFRLRWRDRTRGQAGRG
jgi:pyruvate kinase